jgi:hypothetical protein
MAMIKCVGCYGLVRKVVHLRDNDLVVYRCPGFFPFDCALSGLLRPVKDIIQAAKNCPKRSGEQCILCEEKGTQIFGVECVFMCNKDDRAWSKWLTEHPGKREYICPGKRIKTDRWIEVFREFIEDIRVSRQKAKEKV